MVVDSLVCVDSKIINEGTKIDVDLFDFDSSIANVFVVDVVKNRRIS